MNKTIKQQLETLATDMGVTEADVMMLAQSMINSLEDHKAVDAFISIKDDKEEQIRFTQAYALESGRKWQKFLCKFNTLGENVFCEEIWRLLKEKEAEA